MARSRERVGTARAISVTRRAPGRWGCRCVGRLRTDGQREYELESASLVAQLELRDLTAQLPSERESRAREAMARGVRYSVDVVETGPRKETSVGISNGPVYRTSYRLEEWRFRPVAAQFR